MPLSKNGAFAKLQSMGTLREIESAIERLPQAQIVELADWLEQFRKRRAAPPQVESWLERSRGAAQSGMSTAEVMALTRGEE
jgi:hypothetical protein